MIEAFYNSYVIVLSCVVSFMAAYIACNFCEQLRISTGDKDFEVAYASESAHGMCADFYHRFRRYILIFLIACSLGGVGIWCMHFIGMHAVTLQMQEDSGSKYNMDMDYNFGLWFMSLITCLVTSYIGVYISSHDVMFGKTKTEIVELFVNNAQKYSISEARKITNTKLLWIISTQQLGTIVTGGVITGGGVCIMHYIGMMSFKFDGCIEWNGGIVFASVLIAVVAASAAFWILFRLLSIFPSKEILRLCVSLLMAVAVNGMHYTGMVAATFIPSDQCSTSEHQAAKEGMGTFSDTSYWSFIGAVICANIVLWILVIIVFWDMRKALQLKTKYLKQAEATINNVAQSQTFHAGLPHILTTYMAAHNLMSPRHGGHVGGGGSRNNSQSTHRKPGESSLRKVSENSHTKKESEIPEDHVVVGNGIKLQRIVPVDATYTTETQEETHVTVEHCSENNV